MQEAGLNSVRLLGIVCLNFLHGPWGENSHLHKMRGAVLEWCRVATVEDPLFQECFPLLAADCWGPGWDKIEASKEKMHELLRWLESAEVWDHKKSYVKTGRWHNYSAKTYRIAKFSSCLVFGGLLVLFQEGVYKSLSETPLGGNVSSTLPDAGPPSP